MDLRMCECTPAKFQQLYNCVQNQQINQHVAIYLLLILLLLQRPLHYHDIIIRCDHVKFDEHVNLYYNKNNV